MPLSYRSTAAYAFTHGHARGTLPFGSLETIQSRQEDRGSAELPGGATDLGVLIQMPLRVMQGFDLDQTPVSYRSMVGWAGVMRALDRLQVLTSTGRKIPVFVIAPFSSHPIGLDWLLQQAFVSRGFIVVHIEHPRQHWLSATDRHLNVNGHQYHARGIVQALGARF